MYGVILTSRPTMQVAETHDQAFVLLKNFNMLQDADKPFSKHLV